MTRAGVVLLCSATFLLGACGSEADPEAASTGIEVVDDVIASVEAGDVDDLVARARSGSVPDLGWPTSDGECRSIAVDDPTDVISGFLDASPTLYGVFEGPGAPPVGQETRTPREWMRGEYWLVYSMPLEPGEFTNPGARLHVDEDGAVVALMLPCRGVPAWLTRWDDEPLREIEVRNLAEGEAR